MKTRKIKIEEIERMLPELEKLIEKRLGCYIKLHVKTEGREQERIKIYSEDVRHLLGDTLVKAVFQSIKVDFWGGVYDTSNNGVQFNPKLSYIHTNGGMNGTDFIWDRLWFIDGKWVEGHLLF